MARLSKAEHDALLETLLGDVDIETIANTVQALKDNYDEVESDCSTDGNASEWKSKYEKLHADYINRFFNKPTEPEEKETTEHEEKEDTIDNLFD